MSNVEHLFIGLLAIYISSLENFPLFDWVVCFPGIELYELLVHFGNQSFVSCFICYYFLPFGGLSFHLAYSFFDVQKLLSLIRFHLFTFVFISITLGGGS